MSTLQPRYVHRRCLRRIVYRVVRSNSTASFRKESKDELKQRRLNGDGEAIANKRPKKENKIDKNWELTVGIEIHAQLNTPHKLFSKATTSINDLPNSHVALFDAAIPGTQPVFQKETLIPALRAAIALGCDIPRSSAFDRKHYFYWDQPSGYQITQYYHPLARDGFITLHDHDGIAPEDGKEIRVGIKQIQMEQDTAKTLHQPPSTHLLDFNRVSHPLIEIITLPHIHHPETAAACVRKIQAILNAVDAAVLGMELGGLRADVNVSVRRKDELGGEGIGAEYYGVKGLGQRTEIKNLSSFKAVEDAIKAERDRQISVLEAGGTVAGETRGWTLGSTETRKLRGKEGEIDYRYMPDPDLGPVIIGKDLVDHIKQSLPSLPDEELHILTSPTSDFNLTLKDAKTLIALDDGDRVEYYKNIVSIVRDRLMDPGKRDNDLGYTDTDEMVAKVGRISGNWVLHELGGLLSTMAIPWKDNPITESSFADILIYLFRKKITGSTAKHLLSSKFHGDARLVSQIISDEALYLQPMSGDELYDLAHEVLKGNEKMIEQIKQKKQSGKLHYFVGQMMRRGGDGRVEAGEAERVLRDVLAVGDE